MVCKTHHHLLYLCSCYSSGPNWPAGGEIDIIEGVNDYTNNQATLHTNPGCTLSSTNSQTLSISGYTLGGTDCAASTTGNTGCGIRASTNNSFGAGFNANGGGVYASKCLSTRDNRTCLINYVQCSGMDQAFRSTSFLVVPCQAMSLLEPHNQGTGVRHKRGGLHPAVTHSRTSTTRTRSLTRLCGMCFITYRSVPVLNLSFQRRLGRWGLEQCRNSWSRTELCTAYWVLDMRGICESQWVVIQ
jgi:hypothetical protein